MIHAGAVATDADEHPPIARAIAADPLTAATSRSGFFAAATDAVAAGRIPNRFERGKPVWLEGVCWRPSLCVDASTNVIDCDDCGADYDSDAVNEVQRLVVDGRDIDEVQELAVDASTNEVQELAVDATGGTFTVSFDGQGPTTDLAFDIAVGDFETALEALPNVDPGDIVVTGGPGDDGGTTPYVLTFGGQYSGTNVAEITADGALLTGGAGTATPSTTTPGVVGGTYTLSFDGQGPTAAIAYNATAAAVQAALETLSNVDAGDIVVTGGPGDEGANAPYVLTFGGQYAGTDVAEVTADDALLTGTVGTATPSTTTPGVVGGTYTLSFDGQGPTAAIAYNATAAAVQAALETLSNIAPGDVIVTGGPGDEGGTVPYVLTWLGAYAGLGVAEITADDTLLTGATATATPSTTTPGGTPGGTYTITFQGQTTAAIAYDAAAAAVQAALELLSNIDAGDVIVTGGPGDDGGTTPYVLTFGGQHLDDDVDQITTDDALFVGGAGTATPSTVTIGASYAFPTPPANQEAQAFEVVLRDLLQICSVPLTGDALTAKLGAAFGARLWATVVAANLDTAELTEGDCVDPAFAVGLLAQQTGMTGQGTLLAPSVLLPYLLEKNAVVWVNGRLQDAFGNRVITEGIGIESGLAGTMQVAMVGPVDYAVTPVETTEENIRDYRSNDRAVAHVAFGLVRTDLCAGMQACVSNPTGVVVSEE